MLDSARRRWPEIIHVGSTGEAEATWGSNLSDHEAGASYRVYFLDAANRITGVEELACATDDEACRLARDLGYTGGMEIWCGARLVARGVRGGELVRTG